MARMKFARPCPTRRAVAITPTQTGVTIQNPPTSPNTFETMPAAGGALTTDPTSAGVEIALARRELLHREPEPARPATAGLYTMTIGRWACDADSLTAGAQTPATRPQSHCHLVVQSWVDNGLSAGTWSRPVVDDDRVDDHTWAMPAIISSVSDQYEQGPPLSSSGSRTAYMVNTPTARVHSRSAGRQGHSRSAKAA